MLRYGEMVRSQIIHSEGGLAHAIGHAVHIARDRRRGDWWGVARHRQMTDLSSGEDIDARAVYDALRRARSSRGRVAAYEWVWAPPKGVSVIAELSGDVDWVRDAVMRAWSVASEWLTSRRGAGGRLVAPIRLPAYMAIHHSSSRVEPHVHVHILIGPGDSRHSLDADSLWLAQRAFSAHMARECARWLAERGLAYEWRQVGDIWEPEPLGDWVRWSSARRALMELGEASDWREDRARWRRYRRHHPDAERVEIAADAHLAETRRAWRMRAVGLTFTRSPAGETPLPPPPLPPPPREGDRRSWFTRAWRAWEAWRQAVLHPHQQQQRHQQRWRGL